MSDVEENKHELSVAEKKKLWRKNDSIVKEGAEKFVEVGLALAEIAKHKLYKPEFKEIK